MDITTDLGIVDITRLIDEARHGYLSIPLAELPSAVRAMLMPAVEEGQHMVAAEQQILTDHARAIREADQHKKAVEDKDPVYLKLYDEFFVTVSDSVTRLDGALSELNQSEKRLSDRMAEVELYAVHLPNKRLAFLDGNRFVYEDGSPVDGNDLAVCVQAHKDAANNHGTIATWAEHSSIRVAITRTVELEQRIAGVVGDVRRTGEDMKARPPDDAADLKKDAAAIKRETDDAVAQARDQYRKNQMLASGLYEATDTVHSELPERTRSNQSLIAPAFNANASGTPAPSGVISPASRPAAMDLDTVVANATSSTPKQSSGSRFDH